MSKPQTITVAPLRRYRVERTITVVQYAYLNAETPEDAAREATHNPQFLCWTHSSENDPVIQEVKES